MATPHQRKITDTIFDHNIHKTYQYNAITGSCDRHVTLLVT